MRWRTVTNAQAEAMRGLASFSAAEEFPEAVHPGIRVLDGPSPAGLDLLSARGDP